ncbi:immunoglobulin superfamily member 1-like [Podarcis lilfordi]|nr:immunoglobulin superfamily member 1-like [Podarcis lilfordi]
MRLSFNILFIGFLLAGQWQISGGQYNSKPSISKGPINVNLGGDINLECKSGYHQSAQHFLYKGDSDHSASATQKIEKDAIVFHISNAKESDGGIYRCKYCHNENMCSDFSAGVQVNIKGTANPKPSISVSLTDAEIAQNEVWEKGEKSSGGYSIAMWAGIAASVFLLVLLPLLLAFILSKKRKKGSTANEQAQQVNIPLQSEPEEDPDGVSYAILSHSSLKTKPAPSAGFLLAGQWQISGGQPYPKPSISVAPTNVVSLGGNIILRCSSNYHQDAIYYLHKDSQITDLAVWKSERDAVVFQIAHARASDGGTYTCSYFLSYDRQCSFRSDPVQVYIKGKLHPKPSIAVNSAEMLAEKGNVKISCKAEDNLTRLFTLYIQVGADRQQRKLTEKTATKEAVFAFDNAQEFQGGLYQCRYCYKAAFVELCSDFSDSQRINRINPSLSKPSIKVLPNKRISPGQNITIECQGPEKGLNFSLYKSGELITWQVTESERNRAEFPFFNVGLEDEGNYTCQYHRWGNPFAWSETSNATELVVRANTSTSMEINIRLGVAGLVLLSLVLIVADFMCSRQG